MIRRSVIERIRDELKESPFGRIHPLGEDHSFFKRLERLGIPAYCDARIESHHLAVKPIKAEDYDRSVYDTGPEIAVNAFAFQAQR